MDWRSRYTPHSSRISAEPSDWSKERLHLWPPEYIFEYIPSLQPFITSLSLAKFGDFFLAGFLRELETHVLVNLVLKPLTIGIPLTNSIPVMAALERRALLASQLSRHDRVQGCVAYEQSIDPAYGYKPSTAAGIVFVVAFFLTFGSHCVQTVIKRRWWYSLFAVGALGKRQSASNFGKDADHLL